MPSLREKLAEKKTKLAVRREGVVEGHPADPNHFPEGVLLQVPLSEIRPNPEQPRQIFDPESLAELAESIKEKGVLQPVIVKRASDGGVVLVAGERRVRAARLAGLEKIPAIVTKGNEAEIALIENLQRVDLKPIEEAEALKRMVEEYGYTHEELARVLGKARSTVTETLSLARLPKRIRDECRGSDAYPRRLLVEIAKLGSEEEMLAFFEKVKEHRLNSEAVRRITRRGVTERASDGRRVLDLIRKVAKALEGWDEGRIKEEEKAEILRELKALRRMIEEILD